MKFIMALDLGTTGTRSVIFNEKGKMMGYAYKEWESIYPAPAHVEQDANHWWNATKETIQEALKKTSIDAAEIFAVAITNQRETIVPVSKDGEPLSNAIVWQDRRTIKECEFIESKLGKDYIYKTTGLTIDPYFSASKILWFKNNKPSIYEKTFKFLLVHDFILMKLTGKFITDQSNASRTMLFDINKRAWSNEILDALGIDPGKLPDVLPSGKFVSNVSEDSGCALTTSTQVITGAGDQQCAALGVGVNKKGRVKCTMGTGTFLIAYTSRVKLDPKARVLCSCAAIEDSYVVEASMFSTGSLLKWARDVIGYPEKVKAREQGVSTYKIIDELAEKTPPGSNKLLFLPFMVGAGAPYWNANARGTMFGLAAGHHRGDIYRAIMECTSYDVKKNLDVFKDIGLPVLEIRLTGGGSRSKIWSQILSDVSNIPCLKPDQEEATAVGAAILAAMGSKLYENLDKAVETFISIKGQYSPSKENNKRYSKIMTIYERLYNVLNDNSLFKDLQELDI
ncbi:MAG: xylulokinase [Promethearchaeota archaeon]